jgi:hypothetical protein
LRSSDKIGWILTVTAKNGKTQLPGGRFLCFVGRAAVR